MAGGGPDSVFPAPTASEPAEAVLASVIPLTMSGGALEISLASCVGGGGSSGGGGLGTIRATRRLGARAAGARFAATGGGGGGAGRGRAGRCSIITTSIGTCLASGGCGGKDNKNSAPTAWTKSEPPQTTIAGRGPDRVG